MKTIQLDYEVLYNLYGDCQESKTEIFSEFLSTFSEMKQALFSAYESANLESLKSMLHFYGPSFMYVGAPQVSGFFKKLEARCSEVQGYHSLSADFFELLRMVDDTRSQIDTQNTQYRTAV